MHIAEVEIYSDASNHAVMRHPCRRFPGSLVQGDSLFILFRLAEEACQRSGSRAPEELRELRDLLSERLEHYKRVLAEHSIALPFYEPPSATPSA